MILDGLYVIVGYKTCQAEIAVTLLMASKFQRIWLVHIYRYLNTRVIQVPSQFHPLNLPPPPQIDRERESYFFFNLCSASKCQPVPFDSC